MPIRLTMLRTLLSGLAVTTLLLAVRPLAGQPVAAAVTSLQTTSPLAMPAPADTAAVRRRVTDIDLLGMTTFATGLPFAETEVGGLSGLVYDAANDRYYAISDDRSQRNPARFYTLAIDLADGTLDEGDVTFEAVTTLLDETGAPFAENSLDPEGIALTSDGRLFISSEGNVNAEPPVNPFIREFSLEGQQLAELTLPDKYLPNADRTAGIRNNQAFESLTVAPGDAYLYAAVENALAQDGPQATLEEESLARVLQIDLASGEPVHEYVYIVNPIPQAPASAEGAADNGLVDLLPLDSNGSFLALERSYAEGVGNTIKLFAAQTQGALDVLGVESLLWEEEGTPYEMDPAIAKQELIDLAELGVQPDNVEGMVFGPQLADGRQSLILVSDNNFNETQTTQFIALAVTLETMPIVAPALETAQVIDADPADLADTPNVIPGDADDPAIWVHPTDPAQSLVFVSLKDGGMAILDLTGATREVILPAEYSEIRYNNVDIVYGFPFGNVSVDLVVATDRANDTLAVYVIDPETLTISDITSPEMLETIFGVDDGEQTAYGLATYTDPAGNIYAFVTQRDGNLVAQLQLLDDGNGSVMAELVRMISLPIVGEDATASQSEGIVVDRELGYLYVAMEDGIDILKYKATPATGDDPEPMRIIGGDMLLPDVEGLTIYYGANGAGYLLASSQGDSTYAIFERAGDNQYLGSFVVGDSGAIDQANESDGADLINVPLGDAFPSGLLVVQDGANDPQVVVADDEELENHSTNFKFVPWETVANAFAQPLIIDTESYQPR